MMHGQRNVKICVCVRACVVIIVHNFVLFTTSVISLRYEFTLNIVKLSNNYNNNPFQMK